MEVAIDDLLDKIRNRKEDTNKGSFGHVFVLAGSKGLTGAAALTSLAALRAGAGLVTLGIPESLNAIMEVKLTEAMTLPLPETSASSLSLSALGKIKAFAEKCSVVVIGPGLSQNKETAKLVRKLIQELKTYIVLDADGLNAFQEYNDVKFLAKHQGKLIITPHPGEMSGLVKESIDIIQNNRKNIAANFSKEFNAVTVLKGHKTVVTSPKGLVYINQTGNPCLAKAGTGDVLSGVIAAFVAQGLGEFEASVLGTYVHGEVADKLAKKMGEVSIIASDIIENLYLALK